MSYLQRLAASVNGSAEQPGAVRVALPARFAPTVAGLDRGVLRADDASEMTSEQGALQPAATSADPTRASAALRAAAGDFGFSLSPVAIGRDDGNAPSHDQSTGGRSPASASVVPYIQAPVHSAAAGDSAISNARSAALADGPRLPRQAAFASPLQRPLSDFAVASRAAEPRPTPPTIQVTIDRIDVHAPAAPASRAVYRTPRAVSAPSVSLNDYLRGRRNDGAGT
jgi:hypothetical protein